MAKKTKKTAAPQSTTPSRRELLRQKQEAEARKQRQIRMITIGVIVFAVIIVIAVGAIVISTVKARNAKKDSSGSATAQIVPPNATSDKAGIISNPGKAKQGAPVLQVHSDYQCSACIQYENHFGPALKSLADSGEIVYQHHHRIFMDRNIGNDSSTKAALAASCADTVGAYAGYNEALFKTALSGERGFNENQLRETIPASVGITGENLTKFQQCYDTKATSDFVQGMEEKSGAAGVNGTPTYLVNGKKLDLYALRDNPTQEAILQAIKALT